MGTRHLTVVVKDGAYKVAQYGQWDGNPAGAGLRVKEFVRMYLPRFDEFARRVENCYEVGDAELKSLWIECGADPDSDFVNMDVSERFSERYPSLHRDTGCGILDIVYMRGDNPVPIRGDIEFAYDGLFCEWVWLLDLDTQTLEVYSGFKETPPAAEERFYRAEPDERGYYPVHLGALIPFDVLAELEDSEFIDMCTPLDEDEEAA